MPRFHIKFLMVLVIAEVLALRPRATLFAAEKSVALIQSEIAAFPADSQSRKLAALYSDLGQAYYRDAQMDIAAQAYEKALTYSPTRLQKRHIYLYLGKCYEGSRLDKSLAAYEQAVFYDRKNWRRHRDLGQAYEQLNLYQKAIDSYRGAIKYNPKSGPAFFCLGRTYRKIGLLKEAQTQLVQAEELGENSSALYGELSLVFEGRGLFLVAAENQMKALTPQSSVAEWGRLVYLAALAKDKKMANEGLVQIRGKETSSDTLSFYEELVDFLNRKPHTLATSKIVDPTLRSIAESVLTSPVRP